MLPIHRSGFRPLALLLPLLAFTAPVHAQDDVKQTFEAGMQAYRDGKYEEAAAKFREVVAMQPDNTTALALMHDSQDELLQLLMQGGEFEAFAKEVIAAAGNATVELMRDPAAAAKDAEGAFSATYADRAKAIFTLRVKYGPFAVPPLVAKLTGASEDDRTKAIYALSRLGTEATIPLLACTWSDSKEVRMGALMALASLNDARATARAADLAKSDPDGAIQVLAGKMAEGVDAATACLHQGRDFYVHDPRMGLSDVENHGVVWRAKGPKLEFVEVPAGLVPLELAKDYFGRAADLGEAHGYVGLALVYGTEVAVLQGLADAGNADAAAMMGPQAVAAQTLGQGALDSALQVALEREDVPTASALIQLLDGPGLSAREGLHAAVASSVPSLRFHAAQALASAGDTSPAVVGALTEALSLQALRVVVVGDDNAERRHALAEALGKQGVVVLSSDDGAGAMLNLHRSTHVDAMVVADPLPDLFARRFVIEARKDPNNGEKPIFVIGNPQTGEIDGAQVVDSSLTAETVMQSFGALNGERAQYQKLAEKAAASLAAIAQYHPEALAASLDDLASAASREDEVAASALHALSHAGTTAQLDTAMGVVADKGRSSMTRTAAADAVAGILARNPGASVNAAALEEGAHDGDAMLADACARALALAGGKHAPASVAP